MTVLYSIFDNSVTLNKDNKGVITTEVDTQVRLRTKHTTIKYHHFQSFSPTKGDVVIKNTDSKERITDIL